MGNSKPEHRTESTVTSETEPTGDRLSSAVGRRALVVVIDGEHVDEGGFVVPLDGVSSITIGRGDHRQMDVLSASPRTLRLSLPDRKVSSTHATITVEGSRIVLRDEGSTNGTFIGDRRVEVEELVLPHAPLRVGHTLLTLLPDAAPTRSKWPFVTTSGPFARELGKLERVASTTLPLILLGETGAGKEVVARAVHERSGRPGACLAVNCAALPQQIVEAQLFGHVKGAFSGAVRDEPGFFRAADRGTLLLDEIGDLPAPSQAALLRTLQEGEVTPVGAFKPVKVDVRVIAATHQPLEAMIAEGRFRADLYARLSGFVFRLPPLRERLADLGFLAASLLAREKLSAKLRPEVVEALYRYSWPLNVRELGKVLTAAVHLSEDGIIRLEHLPEVMSRAISDSGRETSASGEIPALREEDIALRDDLVRRLEAAQYNVSQVARDMGKARQQIQRWMRRFGLREKP
ncbi:MAG: sigma 54-interacting transcriptional regulator [Polyangiaceae bacterium]|nr:sigma 54-interacting transcriptional regulator [Polyangiaceae bacterium]